MKQCPSCAEDIQDDAKVCRYCGRKFGASMWQIGVIAVCTLFLIISFSSKDNDAQTVAALPPQAPALLAPAVVKECRALISKGFETGIVMEQPAANRIDVDEIKWAMMRSKTKRLLMQAVSCASFRSSMPTGEDYVVAYSDQSGKRLAMLSSVGLNYE